MKLSDGIEIKALQSKLQFGGCVKAWPDLLLSIPRKRAQGEELLSVDHHKCTPLVREVH